MKTDRFTDIIRRKLESIRPEFTDKDWARMQSTLSGANLSQPNAPGASQPFSGGIWSGQSWLLVAAAISTVVLFAFSIWQRREINQLHQTIGQLKAPQQVVLTSSTPGVKKELRSDVAQSLDVSRSKSNKVTSYGSPARRPDTVYVTRYVTVPSRAKPETYSGEHLSQRQTLRIESKQATETSTVAPSIDRQPTAIPDNQQTESYDPSFTSPSVSKNAYSESTITAKSFERRTKRKGSINQLAETSVVKRRRSATDKAKVATNDVKVETESTDSQKESSVNYELLITKPLALSKKNWTNSLTQRARRMQPKRPTVATVELVSVPASQPVKSMTTRFRAGVSGEVASRLWNTGIYTELLLGKHLTVGVGLNEATYLNRFITEDDFNGRTQRDFRKEFGGRGVNMWGDILNIDTRQVRLQLPVNIGYRIPINQTLTFLTSAGTYLNLTNSENATFYCRQPQFLPMQPQPQSSLTEVDVSKSQPVALVNSLSLGAGIEWQRNHWVVQATPVVTIPAQKDLRAQQTDLNWQQNTTVGLRARLLYQF